MPVVQAEQGMALEPNTVYVIPPGVQIEIIDGCLHLSPRPDPDGLFLPVDVFFRSLAGYAEERAVGVILSGTGSDGADGLREIKAQGGITLVQSPDEAKYDGMPRAAIANGAVDRELSVTELAQALAELSHPPLLRHRRPRRTGEELVIDASQMHEICTRLHQVVGVDFSQYKQGTLKRRLQRRMRVNRITDVAAYLKYLNEHPAEAEALYEDVLIHVTHFFRDPEAFNALCEMVLPNLLERHPDSLRAWVPGCSTGEEVYTLAIVLREALDERGLSANVQIFGTDISEEAVEQARRGVFPERIATDVGQERLRRFFTPSEGNYRIAKSVRDCCIFARQDLTRDPPFSHLDLVLCRNVLIYLTDELQKKVLSVFHYALHPGGYLMLGSAEGIGAQTDLFTPVDKGQRIYIKHDHDQPTPQLPLGQGRRPETDAPHPPTRVAGDPYRPAEHLLLETYAPPAVAVTNDLYIVHTWGRTGPYLEFSTGVPDLNVLKMARPGLLHGLRWTLQQAQRTHESVRREGLRVAVNGHSRLVNVAVYPIILRNTRHFVIAFEDVTDSTDEAADGAAGGAGETSTGTPADKAGEERIRQMQEELDSNRDYLQSTIQNLETANEELQSANEEILSSNEELQSTNEELDTAKEELQSTNEELNTVNEELHARNEELSTVNSDLLNLLASVDIAIVMVSTDQRIRRVTPMAEELLNLRPGDVDRPIGHIRPNIDCADLEALIARVIARVEPMEREVQGHDERWYALRIRPYKDLHNRIDGAVLALLDIDESKRQRLKLVQAQRYTEAILSCIDQPVLVLDGDLRVQRANPDFLDQFRLNHAQIGGLPLAELGSGQWDIPALNRLLEDLLPERRPLDDYRITHDFADLGTRTLSLCGRVIDDTEAGGSVIVLVVRDVTDTGVRDGGCP
jgi:two-component system CheB/CheR fusion protein